MHDAPPLLGDPDARDHPATNPPQCREDDGLAVGLQGAGDVAAIPPTIH